MERCASNESEDSLFDICEVISIHSSDSSLDAPFVDDIIIVNSSESSQDGFINTTGSGPEQSIEENMDSFVLYEQLLNLASSDIASTKEFMYYKCSDKGFSICQMIQTQINQTFQWSEVGEGSKRGAQEDTNNPLKRRKYENEESDDTSESSSSDDDR